ncbi:helix-turn-helix domain-containing protein [Pseudomonas cucumis]|uniref:helix-turn-helix domain-containing protein n=1 Tax=Pseudomonas cucumis TaxID=2954082 RepID=UPI0027366819|nr:hypothetical protein [Pseudomonas cucumis]WLG92445.1 hypothetical protein PSH72_10325 [Pseudomonas cucumis]
MNINLTMGMRLQEERKRLGYSQEGFSLLMGASRRTQVSYETRDKNAGLLYLSKAQAKGLDIYYIISGNAITAEQQLLSETEANLLKIYRNLDRQEKESLMIIAQSLAKAPSKK